MEKQTSIQSLREIHKVWTAAGGTASGATTLTILSPEPETTSEAPYIQLRPDLFIPLADFLI